MMTQLANSYKYAYPGINASRVQFRIHRVAEWDFSLAITYNDGFEFQLDVDALKSEKVYSISTNNIFNAFKYKSIVYFG